MVYLEMAGRLGNQLFRYAFSRKVADLSNEELIIDFKRVYDQGEKKDGWYNSLQLFNVSDYIEDNNSKNKYFFKNATFMQIILYYSYKIVNKVLKKNKVILKKWQLFIQPLLNRYNLYFLELGFYNYDFKYLKNTKVKYICGCFECCKYFEDISDKIKNEFTPKNDICKKNQDLYNQILNENSICITVRRGDFVTNEKNSKLYDVCDKQYFEKAIEIMKEKVINPVFVIFSDDVDWVKKNIDFGDCIVLSEDGTDTVDEKLRLMSACKHFIISNSSFSWWAQYLSKYKDKVVISPNKWYKTDLESDLIEDDWIKIQ